MVNRFEVYLVNLDAEPDKNAKNTRLCVIISPKEMNQNITTVIIAPLSSAGPKYPTRIPVTLLNSERSIVLDQIRVVDSVRLIKKIGEIDESVQKAILERLQEMFAE